MNVNVTAVTKRRGVSIQGVVRLLPTATPQRLGGAFDPGRTPVPSHRSQLGWRQNAEPRFNLAFGTLEVLRAEHPFNAPRFTGGLDRNQQTLVSVRREHRRAPLAVPLQHVGRA